MDELAERAKLALLDLTDDVIELIIERKRKAFAKKQEEAVVAVIEVVPTVDEIPSPSVDCGRNHNEIEEPTYYPPPVVELVTPPTPVVAEPPMDRSVEPVIIRRRPFPWNRK